LRKFILNYCKIKSITICPRKVFQDAEVETLVFIFEKCVNVLLKKENQVQIFNINEHKIITFRGERKQEIYYFDRIFDISIGKDNKIISKLDIIKLRLNNIIDFYYGLKTADDEKFLTFNPKNQVDYKKLLRRSNFGRYITLFQGEYVYYKPDLMIKNKSTARPGEPKRFEEEKIIIMDIAKKLVCTYDDEKYYIKDALILKSSREDIPLKFLVALINSKLLNYYYKQKYKVLSVAKNAFLELPIVSNKHHIENIVPLVDKILIIKKRLNEIKDKSTDEKRHLEDDIKKLDNEIDEEVYTLYSITDEDKKIIEESLK